MRELHLPPMPVHEGDEPSFEFEIEQHEMAFLQFWQIVLSMCMRDGATSLHYHAWLNPGSLYYILSGVKYDMIPPPGEETRRVMNAAKNLISGTRIHFPFRRLFGWSRNISSRFRIVCEFGSAEWAGIVWSVDGIEGIDWHRLD